MIDVFKYSNYREYIKDYYFFRKEKQSSYSYRAMAFKAGINSSSFFKYVIEGKRNLSKGTLEKAVDAFGLKGLERDYFKNLVMLNQAATVGDNARYFAKLTEIRNQHEIKIVEPRDYEFYSEWYHPVVRELAVIPELKSPEDIAKCLVPEVSPAKVRESQDMLLRLGFLLKGKNGGYKQREPVLSSGQEMRRASILSYQIKMFNLSIDALSKAKQGSYLASSTVLGLSNPNFEKAKEIIRKCRYKLLDMAAKEKKVDQVQQLNIHLFPVGKIKHDN